MFISDNFSGNKINCNGEEYLFFSGTSYLGINHNQQFTEYLYEGLKKYGNNYGSSRNSNFRLQVFEEAENALVTFTGAPTALTVSSGFMAGQLVVNAFKQKGHFLYAPNAHPAVCRSAADFYPGDFSKWSSGIAALVSNTLQQDIIIVCNSIDPLFCSPYNFDWAPSLPDNKNITLIIDDSHGLGVTGHNGSGIYSGIRCKNNVNLVVISSLGKAMGIPGGVILGDKDTIAFLRNTSFFSAASPVPPAYLYAFVQSANIYASARKKLLSNIQIFRQQMGTNESMLSSIPGYPVFYTAQNQLFQFLQEKQILISSFVYPKANGEIITRIILNSQHAEEDIRILHRHLQTFNDSAYFTRAAF
ncbi:MAG: aminotransferase class I/II-fold pyridoxal phosphate-dependent enzyme [Chitinophagaceae bacterium]|nr:aminotransferase class I/II-fold pyridoxal phosphate-dependent enzyme [Chitinophagaceae bacterium]